MQGFDVRAFLMSIWVGLIATIAIFLCNGPLWLVIAVPCLTLLLAIAAGMGRLSSSHSGGTMEEYEELRASQMQK